MATCDLCKSKIQTTFLNKMLGTEIKVDGKKKLVCSACQSEHGSQLSKVLGKKEFAEKL